MLPPRSFLAGATAVLALASSAHAKCGSSSSSSTSTAPAIPTSTPTSTTLVQQPTYTPPASAQVKAAEGCGAGTPDATVTGSGGSYVAAIGSSEVYSGSDYYAAITTALEGLSSGQRLSVIASGSIGDGIVHINSGITFEGCGTIDVGYAAGHGAIESLNTENAAIPYLTLTGAPYFGLRFYGVTGLSLGQITMNLSGGLGIRFERDEAANRDVSMDVISVTGAGSHAVETWNIDGLTINSVIARDVGECGLLLQTTTNAHVGTVDGDNVAAGTGYATFRMANRNGRLADGSYEANVIVENVISRGGGRGIFCVSESGGVEIQNIDLSDNENNAILIENCYGVSILGGTVNGGGEVRISARDEFENTRDVSISLEVNDNSARESPCGENITWDISGNASLDVC
ncbi:Putative Ricin B lectin [Aspergillus calidoustus]|uniref:Putative Ricin B lectin n=1 Tax=Aspergillus calidoustus TaxID=454130 RepID=A0A0U5CJ79_ASPCI|nr:Putative Ricin B lectin [Aspergillus calidoustus]